MNLSLLKETFANFVRAHGMEHHFRRLAILDMFRATPAAKELPPSLAQALIDASDTPPGTLLARLGSRPEGLTEAEAEAIRDKVGLNEVEHEKPLPWWIHLWNCYRNPFNLLLTVLAIISYLTEDMKATTVIGSMVMLSTILRFVQESRSNKAADKLKEMVSNTATVLRRDVPAEMHGEARRYPDMGLTNGGRRIELPIKQLVPGDIVLLSAGDMIPADVRILAAKDLFVSQAAMTGESMPVEKFATDQKEKTSNPLEVDNLCFMGTNVVSGSATAVVVSTGNHTYFGALAARVTATSREATAFQAGVNKVSWVLIRFMLVMTPIVLLLNGVTKGDWLEAFLFALSIAVGLTPEMLPVIVTSTLAKGAVILSRQKVIVKRLDAIQNFGAMDVLCTDKTGTLTQDKIFLTRHTDVFGEESDSVLEYAYLNSYYQTGLKNLLDVAVLEHAEVHRELEVATAFRKVDEIPFDFTRRRMSVVVAEHDEHHLLICKGAVEEILAVCTRVQHGDAVEPLTSDLLSRIRTVTADLNEEGLRVVAVAAKELPPAKETYGLADESDLTLVGYIAFLDPPKESTAPALKALKEHGVAVKILTGDNELVTAKICREVGLPVADMLLGSQIERMSDEELAGKVEAANVFAKLSPAHKERIVRVLHDNGHVVGFMGDGINDAAALRAADIGISVDSAVDIAKEAADIILLEKSLMVLEEGVVEGRKTFANMLKYIKMTASSNFGNVFSVLVASAFLPFLPMLPMQLLVQNLMYDISQIAIPFDHVDQEFLQKPQRWNPDDLGRFMVFFGPISSVFDILTFALMWFVFGANSPEHQTLFQSGWFVEGLLSQTLIVHMIRTRKIPFIQSRAAWPLLGMTAIIMAVGILLPMSATADYFKFQALPLAYFPWLALILLSYVGLTQAMKGWYSRRYGWQ
ncbi:magnesium-translocating P-type ATPase [Noviherbaspirillum pedocola]|uniref:Magnesium-transporting ATPase, P-type 1 n=1 Tax=Noviherbaspirillum pedocola TaxID=2801341 RepID=A0A934SY31_9BURK|nr:magnesium-translocating P-type ATPase [Noviherbaspirillum pedocola]MBK4737857.1 magnesium-translocating P-type ATPase [Noviherbaspirillum pedocola]